METDTEAEVASAPAPPASVWEDFIDIYLAPRDVFARRVDGRFWLALLVLTLLVSGLYYASQGPLARAMEGDFQRMLAQMSDSGARMSEEQVAQMRNFTGSFAAIGTLVFVPIGVFAIGVLIWGIGKLFESRATLAVALAIATYSQFPKILQGAFALLQGLVFDPDSVSRTSIGPARFLDPDATSALTIGLLGRLDLFVIWCTVLIAVGLYVAGRVTKTNAALTAALIWVLGFLPLLAGSMRG